MSNRENSNPSSVWDASDYTTHGAFVPALATPVLDLLAAQPGERILDVGCGDGLITAHLRDLGVDVVGIDSSLALVEVARARGLRVELRDASEMSYSGEFDAVFSNAALHWMLDYQAVADRMFSALRPGGRLAVEFGGFGNIAAIRTALRASLRNHGYHDFALDQFYPSATQYSEVLRQSGFVEIDAAIIPRPTWLASGMLAWLRTFRTGLLEAMSVPSADHDEIFREAEGLLSHALRDVDGSWWADYVRLRVTASRAL